MPSVKTSDYLVLIVSCYLVGKEHSNSWLQKRKQPMSAESFVFHHSDRETTQKVTFTVHVENI